MVTITKGDKTTIVTRGVYDNIYKPLGYAIVSDKKDEIKKSKIDYDKKNDVVTSKNNVKNIRK
jgi:hypothetical protein|nr:MAG TPA: hypothetical protein [Caudoviricetes sp.]